MKFPPAATYRSRMANDVASSVVVPNRIAPRLSTLTLRAAELLPMVVYRMSPRSRFARARSQAVSCLAWLRAYAGPSARRHLPRQAPGRVGGGQRQVAPHVS